MLDVYGSLQLLNSAHVRERDKALLRSVMVGRVWNGLLLGRVRGQPVPCRFCGAPDGDGHLFWDWLPMRSGVNGASPWAADASESAVHLVEVALGRYSSGLLAEWSPPDGFDAVGAASLMPYHPNVWTEGSLVLDQVTGVFSSGTGLFAHLSRDRWDGCRWGHVDQVRVDGAVPSCRGFCSVPGPLQSVQRAEMWGVILALQSSDAAHLKVDNLGVVRHVGRLLDGRHGSFPFERVKDGDLLLLIGRMFHWSTRKEYQRL